LIYIYILLTDLKKDTKLPELLITPSTKGILKGLPGVPEQDDVNVRDTTRTHTQTNANTHTYTCTYAHAYAHHMHMHSRQRARKTKHMYIQ